MQKRQKEESSSIFPAAKKHISDSYVIRALAN